LILLLKLTTVALHYACDRGNIAMLKELLQQGADINIQVNHITLYTYCGKDGEGQTGLHYAATVGNIEILTFLLANHANIHIVDNEGESPLGKYQ
jgi:ankyrin repeat protein